MYDFTVVVISEQETARRILLGAMNYSRRRECSLIFFALLRIFFGVSFDLRSSRSLRAMSFIHVIHAAIRQNFSMINVGLRRCGGGGKELTEFRKASGEFPVEVVFARLLVPNNECQGHRLCFVQYQAGLLVTRLSEPGAAAGRNQKLESRKLVIRQFSWV